jgi:hypothetical protein
VQGLREDHDDLVVYKMERHAGARHQPGNADNIARRFNRQIFEGDTEENVNLFY